MDLFSLSDEMLLEIVTKMNMEDIGHLFLTCKKFSSFDEENIWKHLTKIKFPKYYAYKTDLMTWKQICIACNYPMIYRSDTKKSLGHKHTGEYECLGEYIGHMIPNGVGMQINHKRIVVGTYVDSVISGYGEIHFFNGDTYKGNFVRNQIVGQGKMTNKNMIVEGEFKDGRFAHGKVEYLKSGNTYEGSFNQNKKQDGYGIYKWKDGSVYIGNWKDGEKSDMGVTTFPNGLIHIGKYNSGRNGAGKLYWPNGDIFEGTWKDSKRFGKGIFTEFSTQKKYDQFWINDISKYSKNLPERFPI